MPKHVPVLDGLRAVAVMLVLWCHVPVTLPGYPEWLAIASWWLEPGGLGVEVFFVLSGFLITRILLAERQLGAPVRHFLLRRLLRIVPIYALVLAVMAVSRPGSEIAWCACYLFNLASIVTPMNGPLEHTWSLCVEEHFYLLWPLVVAFGGRATAAKVLGLVVMPIGIAALLAACWWAEPVRAQLLCERATPCRCLGLAVGAWFAFAEQGFVAQRRRAGAVALLGLALVLLLHPHVWFLLGPYWLGTGEWIALRWAPAWCRLHTIVACAALVLWCLRPGGGWLASLLSAAPLRAIGRISYGLYLYHLPVYYALAPTPSAGEIALAIAATFAVATLSFVLLERPLLRFGARFRANGVAVRSPRPPANGGGVAAPSA